MLKPNESPRRFLVDMETGIRHHIMYGMSTTTLCDWDAEFPRFLVSEAREVVVTCIECIVQAAKFS